MDLEAGVASTPAVVHSAIVKLDEAAGDEHQRHHLSRQRVDNESADVTQGIGSCTRPDLTGLAVGVERFDLHLAVHEVWT